MSERLIPSAKPMSASREDDLRMGALETHHAGLMEAFIEIDRLRAELAKSSPLAAAEAFAEVRRLEEQNKQLRAELAEAKAREERLRSILMRIRDYRHDDMDADYIIPTLQGWAIDALEAFKPSEGSLDQLINEARSYVMTPEEKQAQVESFARANLAIDRDVPESNTQGVSAEAERARSSDKCPYCGHASHEGKRCECVIFYERPGGPPGNRRCFCEVARAQGAVRQSDSKLTEPEKVKMSELMNLLRTKPPSGSWEDALRAVIAQLRAENLVDFEQ